MVKAKSDLATTVRDFVRVLSDKIDVQKVFLWIGGTHEGYPGLPLVVVSSYFENRAADWDNDPLTEAALAVDREIVAWGFSPGQLAHDPYSPLLEMMLQDAHQVYPPVDAPAQPRARKAKPSHVN